MQKTKKIIYRTLKLRVRGDAIPVEHHVTKQTKVCLATSDDKVEILECSDDQWD